MKKTIYLIAFCLFTLISFNSCSNDDDGGNNPPTNGSIKKIDRVFTVNTDNNIQNEYRFQYNEYRTIKSIVKISNEISFTVQFEYTSNTITANGSPSQGDDFEFVMSFDNDILSNIAVNEQVFPVSYNPNTNSYGMFGSQLLFDEDGDIVSLSNLVNIDYDTIHKGAFHDVSRQYQQLMFLILEENYLTTILASKPVNFIEASINSLVFSNTYDSDGYIETATDGTVSFEYQYME